MIPKKEVKLLATLRTMPPLQGLENQHFKKLAAIAVETEFITDERIYREGDIGQAVYLIETGQVVIEVGLPEGGRTTVLSLGPGQLFGWSALFPTRRKTASARAVIPTRVISLDANQLWRLFLSDHGLEAALMERISEVVAGRMRLMRQQLAASLMQP